MLWRALGGSHYDAFGPHQYRRYAYRQRSSEPNTMPPAYAYDKPYCDKPHRGPAWHLECQSGFLVSTTRRDKCSHALVQHAQHPRMGQLAFGDGWHFMKRWGKRGRRKKAGGDPDCEWVASLLGIGQSCSRRVDQLRYARPAAQVTKTISIHMSVR